MKKFVAITLLVAMLVLATASMAFAQGRSETAPNCEKGVTTAQTHAGATHRSGVATGRLADAAVRCAA